MDPLPAPAFDAVPEQSRIGRLAIRSAPAVAHPAPADEIIHWDFVPIAFRGLDDMADFAGQRLGHMLVRIDL